MSKDEAGFLFAVAEKLYKATSNRLKKQANENHSDAEATATELNTSNKTDQAGG